VVAGGPRNSTVTHLPGDHLSLTRAPGSKFWAFRPTRAYRRFSTTSVDANLARAGPPSAPFRSGFEAARPEA